MAFMNFRLLIYRGVGGVKLIVVVSAKRTFIFLKIIGISIIQRLNVRLHFNPPIRFPFCEK
jgi:hypothetical protein